VKFQVLIVWFF